MKNSFRKSLSLALSLLIVFTLSLTAFAADITAEQAKSIALKDAGINTEQLIHIQAVADYENGSKVFDVEFLAEYQKGLYREYEYEIKAADGKVLEKNWEDENRYSPSNAQQSVSAQSAFEIAQKAFGVNAADAKLIKLEKDYDDGRSYYDVEFCVDYNEKYSCEVNASTGAVADKEVDVSLGAFDKLELFFEVLIAWLINSLSGNR